MKQALPARFACAVAGVLAALAGIRDLLGVPRGKAIPAERIA